MYTLLNRAEGGAIMFIGELINQHRKDHGLTMEEFAERAGISKGYVSMLEKNENPKTKEPIIPKH